MEKLSFRNPSTKPEIHSEIATLGGALPFNLLAKEMKLTTYLVPVPHLWNPQGLVSRLHRMRVTKGGERQEKSRALDKEGEMETGQKTAKKSHYTSVHFAQRYSVPSRVQ